MTEYRFTLQKYKRGSKLTCPNAEESNVSSSMLMPKDKLRFLIM